MSSRGCVEMAYWDAKLYSIHAHDVHTPEVRDCRSHTAEPFVSVSFCSGTGPGRVNFTGFFSPEAAEQLWSRLGEVFSFQNGEGTHADAPATAE